MTKRDDIDIRDIVAILKKERSDLSLSMQDVADAVGCSKSSVHDWEHLVNTPTLPNLVSWAYVLGFHLDIDIRERNG